MNQVHRSRPKVSRDKMPTFIIVVVMLNVALTLGFTFWITSGSTDDGPVSRPAAQVEENLPAPTETTAALAADGDETGEGTEETEAPEPTEPAETVEAAPAIVSESENNGSDVVPTPTLKPPPSPTLQPSPTLRPTNDPADGGQPEATPSETIVVTLSPIATSTAAITPTVSADTNAAPSGLPANAEVVSFPVSQGVIGMASTELASMGGGRGELAYIAKRDGDFDIFLSDLAGNELALTDNDRDDYRPVFSPDGKRLAYHTYTSAWQVFVIDLDANATWNLSELVGEGSFPSWSPDGTRIAFHSNRNSNQYDILIADADGENLERLTFSPTDDFGPAWSPDGTRIAFHRTLAGNVEEIFVVNVQTGAEQQLTFLGGQSQFPVWSPDGSTVIFQSIANGFWQIIGVDIESNEVIPITDADFGSFYGGWSTNGDWVIYHAKTGTVNRDLFMVRSDGSERIRLTETEDEERMIQWRP